jgi:ubiquinone/menaquinone biosynthesis C-methylase UbiE
MLNTDLLKEDFDTFAKIYNPKWNHNIHYHKFLLKHIPDNCESVLNIGCGNGDFIRLISKKCKKVKGIDISPVMVSVAKSRSEKYSNIEYETGDAFLKSIPKESFDVVVSIGAFHHYSLENVFFKSMDWVKKGGMLIVLDAYKPETFYDYLFSGLAILPDLYHKLVKNKHLKESTEIRNTQKKHEEQDRIVSFLDVCKAAFRASATAKIKRHLYWRYSLIWKKI